MIVLPGPLASRRWKGGQRPLTVALKIPCLWGLEGKIQWGVSMGTSQVAVSGEKKL